MRFLVNKDLSAADRPLGAVSHSAAFGLVTLVRATSGAGLLLSELSNRPLMDVSLRTRC